MHQVQPAEGTLFFSFFLPKQRLCQTHNRYEITRRFFLIIKEKKWFWDVIFFLRFSDMIDRRRLVPNIKEHITGKFYCMYSFIYCH